MRSVGVSNKGKVMKTVALFLLVVTLVLAASACSASDAPYVPNPVAESDTVQTTAEPAPSEDAPDSESISDETEETAEETVVPELKMKIDGQELPVAWEDNESVDALLTLASDSPVTVAMSIYGGFEQVGSLGTSIPRNDVQTTTQAGDIVLYSGDQIVVFYGSNSWAYTRLGRIEGLSGTELAELLGNGAVELILFTGS